MTIQKNYYLLRLKFKEPQLHLVDSNFIGKKYSDYDKKLMANQVRNVDCIDYLGSHEIAYYVLLGKVKYSLPTDIAIIIYVGSRINDPKTYQKIDKIASNVIASFKHQNQQSQ